VKIFLFLAGFMGTIFLALSSTARAGSVGGGFRGGGGIRGGGLHAQFVGRNAGRPFITGRGFRRGNRFFGQQFIWPGYWYPYYWPDYYPLDYSLLDNDDPPDYQVVSAGPARQEYIARSATPGPVVVVVNQGNPGSGDSSSAGHANSNYGATGTEGQQSLVAQKSNEQVGMGADLSKAVTPGTQAAPATVQATQAVPQVPAGGGSKYVLVSWLNFSGKDVLYVKNTETNQVQKITSEPNRDNFRIVEVHPNEDPQEFEAIISNGSGQIPVRFGF
jgi:hypothetical protein